ncbi:serine acetyltransferase [Flavobacterium sp.]|uniref:serine acetyltransferase n=1 Tax=Flavobacterium sp. TaxID=239 RepID=UPI0035298153
MFFNKIKNIIKSMIRRFFLNYLYKKYVYKNQLIIDDVEQNFTVRSTKLKYNTKKKFYHLMLYYPEFAFVFFWRTKNYFWLWKILFQKEFYCKIFSSSKIEGGLVPYHPFATVINAKRIGKNFTFRNGLTVGNKNNDNRLLPTIGNNVEVGANVVIIGDIEIGDNVVIGAGSVVVKSIPSNSIVAGNPAKIIKQLNL